MRWVAAILACILVPTGTVLPQERGAAALGSALRGLGVSTRVLIIGAHPDDEDTPVITWLSRGRHVETGYLSLTRGDGGQNVIGNELGEALGVIRTEELLSARRIDGARQYFTRAYDYGFSKNAEEAFTQWPHDSLLLDVMTVVRSFKPHVIISVFSGTPRDGHGQHQAAGILAREAYDWSADTIRVPRSATAGYGGWTVSKFYRGASFRRENATLRMNVGEYDPLLGRSYAELAAISRSQHRSQAFGTLQPLGVRYDYVQREAVRVSAPEDPKAERSMFDGIDTTWARFRGEVRGVADRAALDSLPAAFLAARESYDPYAPERSVSALARIQIHLLAICPPVARMTPCVQGQARDTTDLGAAVAQARGRLNTALILATGVMVEATASREVWGASQAVPVNPVLHNRGRLPVTVTHADMQLGGTMQATEMPRFSLPPDSSYMLRLDASLFGDATVLRWLAKPRRGAMYDYAITGRDEGSYAVDAVAGFDVHAGDVAFRAEAPVVYRFADQVIGEIRRAVAGVPDVSVLLDQQLQYAPARVPIERDLRVQLRSASESPREVRLEVKLPSGLQTDSAVRLVQLPAAGSPVTATYRIRGQLPAGRHVVDVAATEGGRTFAEGYTTIQYEHITTRRIYRPSRMNLEAVDVAATTGMRVGYITGVSDNSAAALEQLGFAVTRIDPETLAQADLRGYTAIVVGPRAYETQPALVANNARLLDYARAGGTLVVQYGQYEMMRPGIMPYPVTINRPHDRVTVEGAPVTILDSTAAILRTPNRITVRDFDDWVQDRSLYMPRTYDPAYIPLLAMSDPGEPPSRGALLVAPLGRGTYVYTTLAFFRQLPNGVPGAARLFVNLLAAKVTRESQ
jgi:LmbE family N-acetylglucosaminyl deacetylase